MVLSLPEVMGNHSQRFTFKILLLFLGVVLGNENDSSNPRAEIFKLTIVHTNDVHAHFVESDA